MAITSTFFEPISHAGDEDDIMATVGIETGIPIKTSTKKLQFMLKHGTPNNEKSISYLKISVNILLMDSFLGIRQKLRSVPAIRCMYHSENKHYQR